MRTTSSIKNVKYSFIGQIINILITFISRTIFIKVLGVDYLGISGLFTNILSILSLAELGIGSSIGFSLYKPLYEKDNMKIKAIMNFYGKIYKIIGCLIGILGIIIIPFLPTMIQGINMNMQRINIIYLLFLLNTIISYFYSYKSTLLIADQKGYIVILNQYAFMIIQNILQIFILVISQNYFLYLIMQIIITFMSNIVISIKANKIYPILKKNKVNIDKECKEEIFKNTTAMMYHKLGAIIVTGTDNILISKFIGIGIVGIYSNYMLLVNTINAIINQMFSSLTASVGNLNVAQDCEQKYIVFNKILFLSFWCTSFCSICLFILLNPFISLWVGSDYLLPSYVVFWITLNFYLNGIRNSSIIYINAMGLFTQIRYKSLIESIINLVFSIIFLKLWGISGVLLGTILSTIATNLWWEPYVVFKYGFEKKVYLYFCTYIKYFFIYFITLQLTKYFSELNFLSGNMEFLYKFIICLIVPNVLLILIFKKDIHFIYFKNILINTIKRIILNINIVVSKKLKFYIKKIVELMNV